MAIAAVILAAGASTRFGSAKAEVRIGSRTMLRIIIDTATAAGLEPIVVVAPTGMTVPEHALTVRNDAPERGMSQSLRMGIGAVPPDVEAAVVLLADQPTVGVEHLRNLDGWRGGTPVVATRSEGVLGPPVLLERDAFGLVEGLAGDEGLRGLLRRDPTLVTPVDHEPIPDVDTPEDLERITEACPGCSARYLPHVLDETHEYIGASPACWAAFGELLAREFQDPSFGIVHRHSVDVYAVQHPGEDGRQQRQSVALHLIGMCHWLEHGLSAEQLNPMTQSLASEKPEWPWLEPPASYTVTVVDVLRATSGEEHAQMVRGWAASVWEAWSAHHDTVRGWARDVREAVIR
jgi:CTP:molybdopterin cytidylyltransferase MocA